MKKFVTAMMAALVFSACAPSTPQARIERNPEKFKPLSEKHKELVQKGLITRGMSRDAVTLAWGPPDRRFEGSRGSKPVERWDYSATRPVYFNNYFGGYGYAPYGYGYSTLGFGTGPGPEVAYVPYHLASVWFVDHAVDSWEKATERSDR